MMHENKYLKLLSSLLISAVLLLTACNADSEAQSLLPKIQGPALIMFYTEG